MKKNTASVSNQDELNKYLQHTSPVTWIILSLVIAILLGFFIWSFLYKLKIKLTGSATIVSNEVTLHVDDADLGKLQAGQYVYISGKEGSILSIKDDGQPVVSNFDLANGEYTYTVIIKEMRPIDFLIAK